MTNVVKFRRRRKQPDKPKKDWVTIGLAAVSVAAVAILGHVMTNGSTVDLGNVFSLASIATSPAERRVHFEMCGRVRHTCIVDGDTLWLDGVNLRMEGYDTPEPYTAICGGASEVALAKRASARFLELLNEKPFTIVTGGLDNTGERTLATIRIDGRDVGDILIDEGLARRWPDGHEWWCS